MPKPKNKEEIAEMKARGFDCSVIREAEERLAQYHRGLIVAEQMRKAFADVKLGDGTGLLEARGLDDYEDKKTLAAYRANDEKENWQKIPSDLLQDCCSSPFFFNANGMRFHLPAYLIAALHGDCENDLIFNLTHLSEHSITQFTTLNTEQRRAVQAYLQHRLEDPHNNFERPHIERALRGFWSPSAD